MALSPVYRALLLSIILAPSALSSPQPQDTTAGRIASLLSAKQYKAALEATEVALLQQPGNTRLWTLRGVAQQALGSKPAALTSFRKALSLAPDYLPALSGAAEIEYSSRDPRARQTLEKVVKLSPENAVAHGMLGVLAFEADDCAAAVTHFNKSRREVEGQKVALSLFGSCLLRQDRSKEAAEVFRRLVDLDPNDANGRLRLALAASALNQPAEAIEVLRPVVESEAPGVDALVTLAESYRALEQVPEAIATYRRAIELYPREERLYIGLTALCEYYNSQELGLEILEIGLQRAPDSARLHAMRGILQFQIGKADQALADFERASEISPTDAVGHAGLALTRLQEGRVEEAIEIARDQMRKNPDDPGGAFVLAQALTKKAPGPKDPLFSEAKSAIEKSVRLAPQFAPARGLLGKLYLQENRLELALTQLETALKLQPDNRAASYQLMIVYRRLGRAADVEAMQKKIRLSIEQERKEDEKRSSIRLLKESQGR